MKATYPLPLELTRPIELASPLETGLRNAFDVENTRYNPVTQVRENPDGVPHFLDCGHHGTSSHQECESSSAGVVIDVTIDIQIDDNSF
jgi:putative ATP-grasp target RiPP